MAKKSRSGSVPIERTLDDVYRYESKKRSSLAGIAMAALDGDRSALKGFAEAAMVFIETAVDARKPDDQMTELAEWLIYVLSEIARGTEPNEAFGWSKKGKGRPSVRQDLDELRKRWVIGQHIAGLLANDPNRSEVGAQRVAADAHHVSVESARNYWEQWQGRKAVK